MDDGRVVRGGQGHPHLLDKAQGDGQGRWALLEQAEERSATEVAHHQIGDARLTPVVVERHNVWVLQTGDQLRLRLKAADEVGVVGVLGKDDLHGHLALDEGLHGTIDSAKATFAETNAELIATDGPTAQVGGTDLLRGEE